jgi:hypothetical protein
MRGRFCGDVLDVPVAGDEGAHTVSFVCDEFAGHEDGPRAFGRAAVPHRSVMTRLLDGTEFLVTWWSPYDR